MRFQIVCAKFVVFSANNGDKTLNRCKHLNVIFFSMQNSETFKLDPWETKQFSLKAKLLILI